MSAADSSRSPFAAFQQRSLVDRDAFWTEQARLVDWQTPFETVCDDSRPPFARWFVGGSTNHYGARHGEASWLSRQKPGKVLLVDRGLAPMTREPGRDEDYAALRERHRHDVVPCVWVESTQPSYTLYTSGTTGRPKGVQ